MLTRRKVKYTKNAPMAFFQDAVEHTIHQHKRMEILTSQVALHAYVWKSQVANYKITTRYTKLQPVHSHTA